MIYNSDISKRLVDIFGIKVMKWSKPAIRNALEEKIYEISNEILLEMNMEIVKDLKLSYEKIKELDDEFTELYIDEMIGGENEKGISEV